MDIGPFKFRKKITGYVSPADEMLKEFNRTHEDSDAQMAEYKKHQRVFQLRDNAVAQNPSDEIWEDF